MISTMRKDSADWLKSFRLETDAVVINQDAPIDSKEEIVVGQNTVTWVNSREKGLSKSRNAAIDTASAKYLLICDDDEEMVNGYEQIVLEGFNKYPYADAIAFQVEGIEREFKVYSGSERKLDYLSSLHVSSVEIALKRDSVIRSGVRFNERFGSGSKYKMGEENIFLYDCLRHHFTIVYIPQVIAKLHMGESTWFSGFTKEYFYNRGAVYRELFGKRLGILMLFIFAIKNYRRFKADSSLGNALQNMMNGFTEYSLLKEKHEN